MERCFCCVPATDRAVVISCGYCGRPIRAHPPDGVHVEASALEVEDAVERVYTCDTCDWDRTKLYWVQPEEPVSAFGSLPNIWGAVNPLVTQAARARFEAGQYADAVFAAMIEVNNRVKAHVKKARGEERDGAGLMRYAFSPKNPVIVLDDLNTQTGKDVQLGYMETFAGAWLAVRNPKAHENIEIDEKRAIHHLFLASLLMEKLDEAEIP